MPRPAMEAAIPIPALVPVLGALGGGCVVVADDGGMDVGRVGKLVEGVGVDVDLDVVVLVGVVTDEEGVEDSVMLLLMDEVAGDDVVGCDFACVVKASGAGA